MHLERERAVLKRLSHPKATCFGEVLLELWLLGRDDFNRVVIHLLELHTLFQRADDHLQDLQKQFVVFLLVLQREYIQVDPESRPTQKRKERKRGLPTLVGEIKKVLAMFEQ